MGGPEVATHSGSENPADFVANFVQEHIFGELWQRDVIDLRTRTLCTIAAIVACRGSEDALKNHVRGALANGATRDQILEVVVHTAVSLGSRYCRPRCERLEKPSRIRKLTSLRNPETSNPEGPVSEPTPECVVRVVEFKSSENTLWFFDNRFVEEPLSHGRG